MTSTFYFTIINRQQLKNYYLQQFIKDLKSKSVPKIALRKIKKNNIKLRFPFKKKLLIKKLITEKKKKKKELNKKCMLAHL